MRQSVARENKCIVAASCRNRWLLCLNCTRQLYAHTAVPAPAHASAADSSAGDEALFMSDAEERLLRARADMADGLGRGETAKAPAINES